MIIENKAKCKLCDDVIESKGQWDFVTCKCGEISVDGGKNYLKRLFKNKKNLIEMSKCEEEDELKRILKPTKDKYETERRLMGR